MPEEVIGSDKEESTLVDSPLESTDVSVDSGSDAIAEDNPIEEPQSNTTDTEPAVIDQSAKAQPAHDYERDYKALQGDYTRKSQELKALRDEVEKYRTEVDRFKGVDPDVLKQFHAQQSIPAWNPQSDKHAQFLAAKERMLVINQMSGLSPEQKEAAVSQFLRQDEIDMLIDWGSHQKREQERFAMNPTDYVNGLIEQRVQQAIGSAIGQYQSTQHGQEHAQSILASKDFQEAYLNEQGSLNEWGQRLNELMKNPGMTYEYANQLLAPAIKNARLEAEMLELRKKTATANERDRLLKDNATDTAELRVGGGDIEQTAQRIAKEKGIQVGTEQYLDLLVSLEQTQP